MGWHTHDTTTLLVRTPNGSRGFEDGQLMAIAPDLSSRCDDSETAQLFLT